MNGSIPPRKKKRSWAAAPLADFVDQTLHPALAKQGFGESDILLHWEEIAGARLADQTQPLRVVWPPRGSKRDPLAPAEPATLVIQVEGAFALEAQHLAPVIIERVNGHLGWRCIGRLQLRQGPVRRDPARKPRAPAPSAFALAKASECAAGIDDEELRSAISRLGAAVFSRTETSEKDS